MSDYDINKTYRCSNRLWSTGFTPLMYYIIHGNINEIKNILINDHTQIDKKNNRGWTAIMIACVNNDCYGDEIVETLIKAGANLDIQNNDGYTVLMLVCIHSNEKMIKILINAGANLNIERCTGILEHTFILYLFENSTKTIIKNIMKEYNPDIININTNLISKQNQKLFKKYKKKQKEKRIKNIINKKLEKFKFQFMNDMYHPDILNYITNKIKQELSEKK